jgi:hypothetical protein
VIEPTFRYPGGIKRSVRRPAALAEFCEKAMKDHWEAILTDLYLAAFGDAARSSINERTQRRTFDYADSIAQHAKVADQVFETIAITLDLAPISKDADVSKSVSANLLTQIAQDTKAVVMLAASGFPYQAVTVSVSAFEHSMMVASIGKDNARAQKWLDHTNQAFNIDTVKEVVRRAVNKLDRENPGLKDRLGDLYVKVYQPLCAFKHGNPTVQQHMNPVRDDSLPLSIFAVADRRATIAAMWALEAGIRAGWLALLSFMTHHVAVSAEMKKIMQGLNRSNNELIKIRVKKEKEPN